MAVEFFDDKYVITIRTGGNPIEDWLDLHSELLTVLSMWDPEENIMSNPWRMLNLIENMMPQWETALKMHPRKKST
ncbi:MAG: hypothetical protein Q4G63_10620 [Bacteroidia bacterium]|nr:hypothetical protein [Bacteroidia bacterium]